MTTRAAMTPTSRALIGAAFILTASAALAFASPGVISQELASRVWGVILGAIVVLYANAAPKTLTPLARMRCDPATEQAVRRFSGWAIVVGGLGYAGAWLVAPLEHAQLLSIAVLGSALLLVMARYGLMLAGRRSD